MEVPPTALLASILGFPEPFFYADDPSVISKDGVTFRALKSMTARQLYRVLAASALAAEFSDWIDSHYKTPPAELPDLSDSEGLDPVVAAATVRSMWAPSQSPIKGLMPLLERKGVRVFALPVQDREVDAFSFWRAERPFIFLNTGRTAERIRFDLAHELGHLLLHRGGPARRSRDIEQQAQDFASSLLIPADALYAQITGSPTFDDIFTQATLEGLGSRHGSATLALGHYLRVALPDMDGRTFRAGFSYKRTWRDAPGKFCAASAAFQSCTRGWLVESQDCDRASSSRR